MEPKGAAFLRGLNGYTLLGYRDVLPQNEVMMIEAVLSKEQEKKVQRL